MSGIRSESPAANAASAATTGDSRAARSAGHGLPGDEELGHLGRGRPQDGHRRIIRETAGGEEEDPLVQALKRAAHRLAQQLYPGQRAERKVTGHRQIPVIWDRKIVRCTWAGKAIPGLAVQFAPASEALTQRFLRLGPHVDLERYGHLIQASDPGSPFRVFDHAARVQRFQFQRCGDFRVSFDDPVGQRFAQLIRWPGKDGEGVNVSLV